jgi:hypothetical protein
MIEYAYAAERDPQGRRVVQEDGYAAMLEPERDIVVDYQITGETDLELHQALLIQSCIGALDRLRVNAPQGYVRFLTFLSEETPKTTDDVCQYPPKSQGEIYSIMLLDQTLFHPYREHPHVIEFMLRLMSTHSSLALWKMKTYPDEGDNGNERTILDAMQARRLAAYDELAGKPTS